jgi:hypothetical protein
MWMRVQMSSRRVFYAVSVRFGLFEGVKVFCGKVATIVAGELFPVLRLM